MRKTKIICTLGPAVDNTESIGKLLRLGMNGARFNFSHGSHESHSVTLANLRRAMAETGLTAASWTHLTDIVTTPGFIDELISLYLARDLSCGQSHPDDDEFLNVVKLPLSEVVEAIHRGEIPDAKTVCAVLMAANLLNR